MKYISYVINQSISQPTPYVTSQLGNKSINRLTINQLTKFNQKNTYLISEFADRVRLIVTAIAYRHDR